MSIPQAVRVGLGLPPPFRSMLRLWPPSGGLLRCGRWRHRAITALMPMSPARFAECLETIGWTKRGLARRLNVGQGAVRHMASGRHVIKDDFAAWLEGLAAVHAPLSPELRQFSDSMGCEQGKWVRYPRAIRPLSDDEAAALRRVAEAHAAAPWPPGWRGGEAEDTDSEA